MRKGRPRVADKRKTDVACDFDLVAATDRLKKPDSHIALVLFARSAQEEACHKNLLPQLPTPRQQQVFEALNQRSLELLAATGLPYFLVSSDQQQGRSFGERLHQALAQTFARGFEKAIVIGNDCPQLSVQDLLSAAALPEGHGSVLGPDSKGGIYLLGLQKSVFEKASGFGQIAWQTSLVVRQLKNLLQAGGTPLICLPTYSDINNARDFCRVRRYSTRRSLRKWLSRLAGLLLSPIPSQEYILRPLQAHPAALFRGPPFYRLQVTVSS